MSVNSIFSLRFTGLVLLLFSAGNFLAVETLSFASTEEYIERWTSEAIKQMEVYSIPASITLAQGILESGNGVSELARKSNNHFGIKCHADWKGGRTYHDDDEKGECFRVYDHPRDSYEDHSKFLLRDRYAMLFDLDIKDYKGWAKGLKTCGYATNPKYAHQLIALIELHNLDQLDSRGDLAVAETRHPKKETEVIADRLGSDIKAKEDREARNAARNVSGIRRIRTTEHGIQYIFARKGDTQKSLSQELDMMPWQFRNYNEIAKDHVFKVGDKIYLQPKKNHAAYAWHTVRKGQTLWEISQLYGIKMKALVRKNHLEKGTYLRKGMKLSMQWPLTKEGKLPWYANMLGG